MAEIPLTPLAAGLPASVPFVGPEAQERARGAAFQARLGANESPFGPSPRALEAMAAAAQDIWKYGDPEMHELRKALATHHAVPHSSIMVGEGIDGLLGVLVRLLVTQGTPVVTSLGAYPTFNYHVSGFGGTLHTVPYHDDHEDPEALVAAARQAGARLIYLANPDNPMGTCLAPERITALLDKLPPGCLLALDEAYGEFAPVLPRIDASDTRVIRLRTFSKAYGMAGLRVGYAIGAPGLIAAFNKVRNHFGVGRLAQAGACAALADAAWLDHVREAVASARHRIGEIARDAGLTALPSATNFVALDCGGDGARAGRVRDGLLARGIFVRMPFVAPGNRCIRVTCGTDADLDAFAEALPGAIAEA